MRELDLAELLAAGGPQVPDVGAGVVRVLVEAQRRDEAVLIGAQLHADLERIAGRGSAQRGLRRHRTPCTGRRPGC